MPSRNQKKLSQIEKNKIQATKANSFEVENETQKVINKRLNAIKNLANK